MNRPNYMQIRALLGAAEDAELTKVLRLLDRVFGSDRLRPSDAALAHEQDLIDAVKANFPRPFARRFSDWLEVESEFQAKLKRWREGIEDLDEEEQDRERRAVSRRFREAFLELWACWLQIVRFMPFILIAALKRCDDDLLKKHAANELALAMFHYNTFYESYDDDRKKEADQLFLLIKLNRLFRKLSHAGVLTDQFILASLADKTTDGFAALFPERFDNCMQLILQLRNRVIHDRVEEHPPQVIEALDALVHWCFLDILFVLAPIARAFSLVYVARLDVGMEDAAGVEALDFSGSKGPYEVRYQIAKTAQPDDYAFVDLQLYLIARSKQLGPSTAQDILEPHQYLDLTPFLIAGQLQQQEKKQAQAKQAEEGAKQEGRRLLYALKQYLEPSSKIFFSELGGTEKKDLSGTADDWQGRVLLQKIGDFKLRMSQLTAQIPVKEGVRINADGLKKLLWLVSADHLANLMNVHLYDADGARISGVPDSGLTGAYDEELFIEPPEGVRIDTFLASPQRALVLVGNSGFGKSNLLIDHFLRELRQHRLAVFLSARQFNQANFRDVLVEQIVGRVPVRWSALGDLHAFLEENAERLTVFVDAINEYSGPGGSLALLADLITTVKLEPALQRCKIVVTCRSESWLRYIASGRAGARLDPAIFATEDGDAPRVRGFVDRELRRKLYAAYQRRYRFLPEDYAALSEPVQALIAQPLMLALIAESYASPASGPTGETRPGIIPSDLNYFGLFRKLTDRKLADAQMLVPVSAFVERERLPGEIDALCDHLAKSMYDRLTSDDPRLAALANREALPLDDIDKRYDLQAYVRGGGEISVLEAVLQVGLMERVRIPLRDLNGREVPSSALTFFHDQYTQYWLAVAYQRHILGALDPAMLADSAGLETMTATLATIVRRGIDAPVLTGALDHWLQMNLENYHGRRLQPVLPLLDRLAAHDTAIMRYYAMLLPTNLILRRYLSADEVYGPAFQSGGARLRYELAGAFVAYWPGLPPAALASFVNACDPDRDPKPVERLADIFTLHLLHDPAGVTAYLDAAIEPLKLDALRQQAQALRQFKFSLQVSIFAIMSGFDQPGLLDAVRKFFRSKYRLVLDMMVAGEGDFILFAKAKKALWNFLFSHFNIFGAEQWEKFIASMPGSGNDRFFSDLDGVVQRDVLAEFLPYAVDLHNGDFARLSLAEGTPFRELMLRMLDFRPTSIIGYNAVLCLPSVLMRNDWAAVESFILQLIERRTPSALFFGNLILVNLSYSDRKFVLPALTLMRDRIVPLLLRERLEMDWSIIFCIATLDVAGLWEVLTAILHTLFDDLEKRGEAAASDRPSIDQFGTAFFKIAYCHDIALSQRVAALLLEDAPRFLGPVWRSTTLTFFAAMLARQPANLQAVLADRPDAEHILRETRAYQTGEIVEQSRLFPFQVDVNRFVAWLYVAEPRLRHVIVKCFIGSLACGSGVADFVGGVRETVITVIRVFLGKSPEDVPAGRLSVAEIAAWVATEARKRGKG